MTNAGAAGQYPGMFLPLDAEPIAMKYVILRPKVHTNCQRISVEFCSDLLPSPMLFERRHSLLPFILGLQAKNSNACVSTCGRHPRSCYKPFACFVPLARWTHVVFVPPAECWQASQLYRSSRSEDFSCADGCPPDFEPSANALDYCSVNLGFIAR